MVHENSSPPAFPAEVFVDTSGLYAALARFDTHHPAAGSLLGSLLDSDVTLVSSSYVVVETAALLQSRFGVTEAGSFLSHIVPALDVGWVDQHLHERGAATVLSGGRCSVSLVDAVSFELMRELTIDTAFTFDRHFADQGFTVVPGPVVTG